MFYCIRASVGRVLLRDRSAGEPASRRGEPRSGRKDCATGGIVKSRERGTRVVWTKTSCWTSNSSADLARSAETKGSASGQTPLRGE
eukprot:6388859-Pyramimonas_sp.AAC.2